MDVNVDVKTGAKKNPPPPTKAPNEVSVGVKTKGGNRIAPAAPKAPEAPQDSALEPKKDYDYLDYGKIDDLKH